MKLTMTAACAALLLAGCATPGPLSGTGSTPSSVTQTLNTTDEKALLAVEASYGVLLRTVTEAANNGTLRGENAAKARVALATANNAVRAARAAYAAGNAVQMMAQISGATSAIGAVRALMGR